MSRYGTPTYTSEKEDAKKRMRDHDDAMQEISDNRTRKVQEMNARSQRQITKLFAKTTADEAAKKAAPPSATYLRGAREGVDRLRAYRRDALSK